MTTPPENPPSSAGAGPAGEESAGLDAAGAGPSRRRVLSYAGVGGLGLLGGVALGARVSAADQAVQPTTPQPVVPGRVSPYGAHQPGVTAPTPLANRLVAFTVNDEFDFEAAGRLMRLWTSSIEAVTQGRPAPGDTARDLAQDNVDLTVTVGWGPDFFTKIERVEQMPPGLVRIPAFTHDQLEAGWSGGDLLLMIAANDDTTVTHVMRRLVLDAGPFARVRWEQSGSWRRLDASHQPHTGRNLFGQVDGTGNLALDHELFDATVWAKAPDWFAGGTTMVVRRISMNLDTWDELTRQEQELSVGRDLDQGAPLTGAHEADVPDFEALDDTGNPVIPPDSHLALSHHSANGGARILRRGMNYTTYDAARQRHDSGLIFVSFQADVGAQFVPIQRSLDRADQLNEWTIAVGSAEFAVLPGFAEGTWLGQPLLG